MSAAMKPLRIIASAVLLLATLAGLHEAAFAYSAMPQLLTGRTNKSGSLGCGDANCHTSNVQNASVSITGPAALKPGQLGTYTVTATRASLSNGAKVGMAAAASDSGTPLSESAANLVVQSGEIIHSSAGGALNSTNGSGSASYQFNYTMPGGAAVGSVHTLYAVAAIVQVGIAGSWNHASNFNVTALGTAPAITSASPPATGKVGTPYSHTYTATGNPKPTFSVSAGALPTGLLLNPSTGVVTGPPTAVGVFSGKVTASNGVSPAATQNFSITIAAASAAPAFTSAAPPGVGTVGVPYTHTYTATGNPAPTFAVTEGALPTGLALDSATGAVTGRPNADGTFSGTVTASNGVLPAATQPFTIVATRNYQGLWWASPPASESGWGINFAHQGDLIFATWFTYGADGKPTWFIVLASKTGDNVYEGDLSRVTGPPFYAVPFDPGLVAEAVIGNATLTFAADGASATFAYTVNGISQVKQIERQEFATPLPRCTWGTQADLSQATNFQDLWWRSPASSESGWGINFTQQGDIIFATWFTYGPDGEPTWFIVLAVLTDTPNVYAGEISTVTGPPFNAVPFDPALIVETVVGSATLTFADGNSATFDYTIGDVNQVKPIVRQVFVAPGTLCQ